jgi:CheY-like chemotaxis protein
MAPAVLFVDDSPAARAMAERRLRAAGLRVTALGSKQEATTVDTAHFRVALLDLELGDGLGTELAAHLRQSAPALPIAFLTASPHGSLRGEAARFGPVFCKGTQLDEALRWVLAAMSG